MCGSENGGIQMAEAPNISEALAYIREREETLSRYSDKLRQSLAQIAQVFGNADYCQRCDKWRGYHETEKARRTWGACERFVPQIAVSIDIVDDEPFHIQPEDDISPKVKYYLAIRNHKLGYTENVGTYKNGEIVDFLRAPRELLKALVKSGRLIPFLQKVADTLQEKCEEYKQVAEVAEKLAKAISP
jgi:hypothetical protein